jgi:hypothetical protein
MKGHGDRLPAVVAVIAVHTYFRLRSRLRISSEDPGNSAARDIGY